MLRYTLLLLLVLTACADTTPSTTIPGFFISAPHLDANCGSVAGLNVEIDRYGGFDEKIEVSVSDLPDGVNTNSIIIPPNATEGELTFEIGEVSISEGIELVLFANSESRNKEHSFVLRVLCEEKPTFTNKFLDPNFGDNGVALANFPDNAYAYDVAIDADGKIVVAGVTFTPSENSSSESEGDFAIVRYNADGSLDASFGEDGKVATDFGGAESAEAITVDENGKILVAGYIQASTSAGFALARYNTDGSLDGSFGNRGRTVVEGYGVTPELAIDSDGKILLAADFALLRLNADGSLDTSFGSSGVAYTITYADIAALALTPDGKIILAGGIYESGSSALDFIVSRYNADGSPDKNFGKDGVATTDFGGDDFAYALSIDRAGKIVVGGYTTNNVDFALVRYNTDGSLDTSFGENGKVTTDFDTYGIIYALALDKSNNLLAAGYNNGDFGVARYKPDGSLDTSFGVSGIVTDIFAYDRGGAAQDLALTQDGEIVLVGHKKGDTKSDFSVVQVLP